MAGCVTVLITASCLGSYFFNIPVKPMPITIDRVLWAVLLAQYVLYRRFGKADPKQITAVEWLLFAFIGWIILGCVTNSCAISPLPRLFFSYLMPLGLYWVARQMTINYRAYRGVLIAFVIFGAYLSVTALAEVKGLGWLIYPKYIFDPSEGGFFGRARGPFLNPVANGMAITLAMLSAVLLWSEIPRRWRLILSFAIIMNLAGVYLTQTRCVWLGTIAALGIFFITKIPKAKRIPLMLYCLLIGAVLIASQWESLLFMKRDKGLTAADAARSVELRPILAVVAWKMFKENPIDGVGLAQYDPNAKYYLIDRDVDLTLEKARGYTQHNVFLSLLTETGLVGMTLFTIVLGMWAYNSLKLYGSPTRPDWVRLQGLLLLAILGAYLPNAMFQDVSQVAMVNMFLFFEAGLTMNLLLSKKDVGDKESL